MGFIPTTKVFIDTPNLLPSASCPLPFFVSDRASFSFEKNYFKS
jgi:hypothetical protein